jgi:hypothetical protein
MLPSFLVCKVGLIIIPLLAWLLRLNRSAPLIHVVLYYLLFILFAFL